MYVNTNHDFRDPERGACPWVHVCVPLVDPTDWLTDEVRAGLQEVERIAREAQAAMALLVSAMPESRDAVADLSRTCGISNREARRRRDVAKVIEKVDGALQLLRSGAVSAEHVAAIVAIADRDGAAEILRAARLKSPEDVGREAEQFRLAAEHGSNVAKRQRTERRLRFHKGPDGMIGLSGLLPPVEGRELQSRLAALVDARWRSEHPERARILGGHGGDTVDQRMADALLEIAGVQWFTNPSAARAASTNPAPADTAQASASPTDTAQASASPTDTAQASASPTDTADAESPLEPPAPSEGRASATKVTTAKPAVVILFNVDRWEAELSAGHPIPVTASLFDQTRADLYYCFQNMQGEVLKFGKARRNPSPAQRLAVLARDRTCAFPGCHAPPERCDFHHLKEVLIDQGLTDVDLLGLFCKPHHRYIHLEGLTAERESDGGITIRQRETGMVVARAPSEEAA